LNLLVIVSIALAITCQCTNSSGSPNILQASNYFEKCLQKPFLTLLGLIPYNTIMSIIWYHNHDDDNTPMQYSPTKFSLAITYQHPTGSGSAL